MSPTFVEDFLSYIEGTAAPILRRLIQGDSISADERLLVAYFLWFQRQRTPLARSQSVFMLEQTEKLFALTGLQDSDRIRTYFEENGEPKTAEEIKAWQDEMLEALRNGSIVIEATPDHEVLGMFLAANDGAIVVAHQMSWVGLRAPANERFILSDHPLALYDPNAGYADATGWLSSYTVEVTMPLEPSFCLMLRPGPPIYQELAVDRVVVQDVNLRTYAHAQWSIFGATAQDIQVTRAIAKKAPKMVVRRRPRAPGLTIFEREDGQTEPFNVETYRAPTKISRARRKS
jgi:hypothetical protein